MRTGLGILTIVGVLGLGACGDDGVAVPAPGAATGAARPGAASSPEGVWALDADAFHRNLVPKYQADAEALLPEVRKRLAAARSDVNAIPAARRADEAGRAASEAFARAEGQVRQLEAIVGSVEGALDFARAQLGGGIGFEIELRPGGTFSARESEVGTVTHELTGDWVIDGENVTITTRQRDGQPPKPGEVAVKNGIFRDGRITMAMPGGVAVPMVRK